jgi:hypothetical protein
MVNLICQGQTKVLEPPFFELLKYRRSVKIACNMYTLSLVRGKGFKCLGKALIIHVYI